jgi:carotenoid 1,2-hydratase
VRHDGYAWWYLDALSDDGAHGLTIIAFIGSVFSPYYAWARRRGPADPSNHCALNVALYGPRGKRWSMTERGAGALGRGPHWLAIGPSSLLWDQTGLIVTIDEVAAPVPRRIRGTVRLIPSAIETRMLALDDSGLHRWQPIAPCAEVEVSLTSPALSWRGRAYFDSNAGDRALEDDFRRWTWSRAVVPGGTTVSYDVTPLAAKVAPRLAMRFDAAGGVADLPPLPEATLPRTRWGITRAVGTMRGHIPEVVSTLEDTPFYARSIVATTLTEGKAIAVHESLSLERFRTPWVRAMLPFRMPRAPALLPHRPGRP